ncbi:hypothetical protein BaRGS_00004743, partial [Batillaria attramentaria]
SGGGPDEILNLSQLTFLGRSGQQENAPLTQGVTPIDGTARLLASLRLTEELGRGENHYGGERNGPRGEKRGMGPWMRDWGGGGGCRNGRGLFV